MSEVGVFAIGMLAQGLFCSRLLIQWIASERAKEVLSPVIFWQLSMAGSLLLCLYGWLRNDFAIISGQFIAYYIYIWNLKTKGSWQNILPLLRQVFILTPIAALLWGMGNLHETIAKLFVDDGIPMWLLAFGITAQLTFTLRFVYQWWYSKRAGESTLPPMFWIISLAGAAMIIFYGAFRKDAVLIIGQSTGVIAYTRNLMIWRLGQSSSIPDDTAPSDTNINTTYELQSEEEVADRI